MRYGQDRSHAPDAAVPINPGIAHRFFDLVVTAPREHAREKAGCIGYESLRRPEPAAAIMSQSFPTPTAEVAERLCGLVNGDRHAVVGV